VTESPPLSLALVDGSTITPIPPGTTARRRGTDGVWRRFTAGARALDVAHGEGPGAPRQRLLPGGVVRLGRRAGLVVQTGGPGRYPDATRWCGFLARDPSTLRTLTRLGAAASSDAPVWLMGESGTGKELAARALHEAGPRASGPWVTVNCAALPETLAEAELFGACRGAFTGADRDRPGAFTRAHGGTLFLDEVGELPLATQAKLLRALESGEVQPLGASKPTPVNVRVVAATWRDLDQAAASGSFRFDLLQRLGVLRVSLPPLRQRPLDIGPLLEASLAALDADDLWPDPPLLAAVEGAPWPGNVRQLRNAAQRAAVWGRSRDLLPPSAPPPSHRRAVTAGHPKGWRGRGPDRATTARDAIRSANGNRASAARSLGVSRSTLYRWLARSQAPGATPDRWPRDQSPVDTH